MKSKEFVNALIPSDISPRPIIMALSFGPGAAYRRALVPDYQPGMDIFWSMRHERAKWSDQCVRC